MMKMSKSIFKKVHWRITLNNSIFPDAKKKLKTENGPKLPVASVDERNQVVMKGLFSSLKHHGDGKNRII